MVHHYKYLTYVSYPVRKWIQNHGGENFNENELLDQVRSSYDKLKKMQATLLKQHNQEGLVDIQEFIYDFENLVIPELLRNPIIPMELKTKYFPEEMEARRKAREAFRRKIDTMSMALARERSEYGYSMEKAIRKRIVQMAALEELCADLQAGTIPSAELIELADLLRVDITSSTKLQACTLLRKRLENGGMPL
jgi:hypothetical protein